MLNDPSNPATSEGARSLADSLEWISILLMFGNVVLGMVIEFRVINHVQVGDEDYRVRLIKQQIEDQEKGLELARQWLAKADAKAKAKGQAKEQAKERAAGGKEVGLITVNPLRDDASDDEMMTTAATTTMPTTMMYNFMNDH